MINNEANHHVRNGFLEMFLMELNWPGSSSLNGGVDDNVFCNAFVVGLLDHLVIKWVGRGS